MVIGLPVVEGHELTKVAIDYLTKNAVLNDTKIVIIDNGSDKPYKQCKCCNEMNGYKIDVIRNEINAGFYRPLEQLWEQYDDDFIGIMHNDLIIYEQGWDRRMRDAFDDDPQLGLIGLCGSREVDERGGRGGYTVCNFQGREIKVGDQVWKGQDPSAGRQISGIEPAIVLDSLFMMFRSNAIPSLEHNMEDWKDITLAHFYDRIWPIRIIEAGYHVVTMGLNIDHIGGLTTTGNERYRNDCIKWLDDRNIPWRQDDSGIIAAEQNDPRNIPCGNPETQMYLVAESRYLKEYKDQKKFLPAIILEGGYEIRHSAR